jgi:hypothetical protein
MEYSHTQRSPLGLIVLASALFAVGLGAWLLLRGEMLGILFCVISLLLAGLAMCFWWLKIEDRGESLRVQFGPLPFFGTSILYQSMVDVSAGQASLIDGWGVHYIPMRGWIYNVWGWDCAIVKLKHGTVRLGTDDPDGLVAFLETRLPGFDDSQGHAESIEQV